MAISPQEALKLTPDQEALLGSTEESIDAKLRGIQRGEKRKFPLPSGLSDALYNVLKSRYTSLGWNVQVEPSGGDYRDSWPAQMVFSVASVSGCSVYDAQDTRPDSGRGDQRWER